MKVILIHGIHSKEGDNNMSALLPHIKEAMPTADIELFEYGFMGFWKARWANDNVAKSLAGLIDSYKRDGQEVAVVTHSNGAAITYLATTKYNARPTMVVNVNPALDRWRTHNCPWVETIHSEQDRAVDISQWLPFHLWGDQGKVGYKGKLKNTINHNATKFGNGMAYQGHCGLFGSPRIKKWAYFIAARIESYVKAYHSPLD